jgi:hypothetical protein
MKINITRYVVLSGIIISLMSCSKVFDDITQYKSLTPELVWTDPDYTTQYVNKFYSTTWSDYSKNDATATEEYGLWQQNVWTAFYSDQMSVSGSGIQAAASFSSCYTNIRDLNRFFENVDKGSYTGKKYLKGQAFFFMATQYFRLVKSFGGVPIVKEVINASNPDPQALGRPRNSTLETFDYITSLLDSAIVNLPEPSAPGAAIANYDAFRITKPVAMILKGEVLMWKASPIFCTTPNQTYWQNAYDAVNAAKTFIQHGEVKPLLIRRCFMIRQEPKRSGSGNRNFYTRRQAQEACTKECARQIRGAMVRHPLLPGIWYSVIRWLTAKISSHHLLHTTSKLTGRTGIPVSTRQLHTTEALIFSRLLLLPFLIQTGGNGHLPEQLSKGTNPWSLHVAGVLAS